MNVETTNPLPDLQYEILSHDSKGQMFVPGTEPRVILELANKVKELHESRIILLEYGRREKKLQMELATMMHKYDQVLEDDTYSGIKRYWAGDLCVEISIVERQIVKTHVLGKEAKRRSDDLNIVMSSLDKDLALESLILRAMEESQAWLVSDLVGDTGIERKEVVRILLGLEAKGVIRRARRDVPGSDRPQIMFKSNRVDDPEAD